MVGVEGRAGKRGGGNCVGMEGGMRPHKFSLKIYIYIYMYEIIIKGGSACAEGRPGAARVGRPRLGLSHI